MKQLILTIAVLLSLCSPLWAAITHVQGPITSGEVQNPSVSITPTVGNSLIIIVYPVPDTNAVTSVTITSESNGTMIGSVIANATLGESAQLGYLCKVTTSGAKTVQANINGGNFGTLFVEEYSGLDTGTCYDSAQNSSSSTSSSTSASTTFSTNTAHDLIVCAAVIEFGALSNSQGYTMPAGTANNWNEYNAYNTDVGAAGSQTPTFTITSSPWVLACAGFKPPGSCLKTLGLLGVGC